MTPGCPPLLRRFSTLSVLSLLLAVAPPAEAAPQLFKELLQPKAKKVADFGWTDSIHQKYKGRIVFSTTPILFKQGQEDQLKKEFTLNDDLYLMAYFERSFHNQVIQEGKGELINEDASVQGVVTWEVNGNPVGGMNNYSYHIQVPSDQFSKWTGASYPESPLTRITQNSTRALDRAFNAYVVPALRQGRNQVRMIFSFDLYSGAKKAFSPAAPMAIGEFTIQVKDLAELKAHLVKQAYLPESEKNDPKLEAEIKAIMKNDNPVKVIFLNGDWDVVRKHGEITQRNIAFTVVLKKGEKFTAQNHIAWQEYQGGGKYGRTQVAAAPTHVMDVPSLLMK